MKKPLSITLAIVIILAIGAGALVATRGFAKASAAQPVPENAYFKDVKKLSEGTKPACLANNDAANKAVMDRKSANNMYSLSFDIALGTRIIDMPAGMFDTTVNSFSNNQAKGTITFSDKNQQKFVGDLKNFNYVASVNPANNQWKLDSLIACQSASK